MKTCVRYLSFVAIACLFGAGCAENAKPTTQPSSVRDRFTNTHEFVYVP